MDTYKELNQKYLNKVKIGKDDQLSQSIFDSLLSGRNEYIRLTTKGSSSFDPTWIDVIEDCLFDLGDIVNNPREVTKIDSNVTPIELAKKIDGESVQHLASHSQYVKEVDKNGEVVPSKILSHTHVEDFHTYENRFIATFIRRLMLFIEKRYEYIYNKVSLTKDDILFIKNKSIVNGAEVEIETKITVKKEENDDMSKQAREYISRIELLREYVSYYYNSKFMKDMKNEKDVRRPILQTNIIRKNPKYHKCYEAFLFIERFATLGVSFKVSENYQSFNEQERKNINYLLYSSFLSINDEDKNESIKKVEKVYKPRFHKSIDDEEYVYGELSNTPLEFVRVDKEFLDYLNKKLKKDVPIHPHKFEREFYHDEIIYRKDLKEYNKELERLLSRKNRTLKEFEKLVSKRIDERDREEALEKQRFLEAQLKFEDSLIERKRKEIIEAAKAEALLLDQSKKEKKAKKAKEVAPVVEEPKEEVQPEVVPEPTPEPVVEEPQQEEPIIAPEVKPEEPIEEPKPAEVEPEVTKEPEPIVEEPAPEVTPEPEVVIEPEPEPVVEEPKEEVKPEPLIEPVKEEAVAEPIEEPKKEETKKEPTKKPRKAKPPVKKEEKPKKEAKPKKVKEEKPEPIKEEVKEEPKPKEKKVKKEPKANKPKVEKAKKEPKVEKPKPVKKDPEKKEVKEPEKKVEPKKVAKKKPEIEKIPGRFIVKTIEGYYVNQKRLSNNKEDAKIFDDYNKAKIIKKEKGGKIVKL